MATRLYPNTDDTAVLETLCYVPAGTGDRLKALQAEGEKLIASATDRFERQEKDYKAWSLIQNDTDAAALDAFLTFGWGRIRHIPEGLDCYSGTAKDPQTIREICQNQPLPEATIEILIANGGVHWS